MISINTLIRLLQRGNRPPIPDNAYYGGAYLLEDHRLSILNSLYQAKKSSSQVSEKMLYRLGFCLYEECKKSKHFPFTAHRIPTTEFMLNIPALYDPIINLGMLSVDADTYAKDKKRFALSKQAVSMRVIADKEMRKYDQPASKRVYIKATDINYRSRLENKPFPYTRLTTIVYNLEYYWGVFPTVHAANRVIKEIKQSDTIHKLVVRSDPDPAASDMTPMTSLAPTEKITVTRDGYVSIQNHLKKAWLGPFKNNYEATKMKMLLLCEGSWEPYFAMATDKKHTGA